MREDEITLRVYMDSRFEALDKQTAIALSAVREQTALALTAAKEAVSKAEVASEKRFEGVNKFREALDDNARLLMPRLEAEQHFRQMTEKLVELTKRVDARDDRGKGLSQGWAILIAAVGIIVAAAALLFK